MQFDEFDKKIKDAAEHHHPAYDEQAWTKMESLLDKHMPVKKDRRRGIIFFLFLFLILGSGAFLLMRKEGQHSTSNDNRKEKQNTVTPVSGQSSQEDKEVKENATVKTVAPTESISPNAQDAINSAGSNAVNPLETNNKVSKQKINDGGSHNQLSTSVGSAEIQNVINTTTGRGVKNKGQKTIVGFDSGIGDNKMVLSKKSPTKKIGTSIYAPAGVTSSELKADVQQPSAAGKTVQQNNTLPPSGSLPPPLAEANSIVVKAAKNDSLAKTGQPSTLNRQDSVATVSKKADKPKKIGKQKSFFAVTFTTGPDLSFIGASELGKVKLKYGAGLSYGLNRFVLRSGFYITDKVYSAPGADYHPFYPNLQKVDGDCKVYEIPVTLSYNFKEGKKYNWFASTGLSSYLMKKESYGYLSKEPATGMTYYTERTVRNKNKHYFSILNLSAGYERKFNNTFSLLAEPYLQVPLTGIGNGKMKLNSGGVLFTLSVKPFARKK